MSAITTRAIELAAAGMSPSEATAFAVQGRSISASAVQRVEMIVSAYLRRLDAERAIRRAS
jgi:hypothetical protein